VTDSNLKLIADDEPGYGQIFAVLLRRRFWLLGILSSVVGLSFVMTSLEEPTYVSSMQLLVEPNYQGKQTVGSQNLNDQFTDTNVQIDVATQISLMRSTGLLQKAMTSLRSQYPDIDPDSPSSVSAFKGSLVVSSVEVADGSKDKGVTKIFQILYTSNDPIKTQNVLKTMQRVYQDYNLEQQKLRLTKGLAFIDEQLPQIENKVERSESALEQFRSSQGLIDPEEQAKAQVEALNEIQEELRTNSAQIGELQDRYASLQSQVGLSPQQAVIAARLTQSPRYQTLLDEIQKTELELIQQRLLFNDNTAEIQVLLEKRQKQDGLLQDEVNQIVGDSTDPTAIEQLGQLDLSLINSLVEAEVNLRALEARNASLAGSEQQLQQELQRFPSLLAEFGRLQPEIELNRDTLKQLLAARQELGLAIAKGGFDWQVVEEPQKGGKTGPSLLRNLLLGAVAGLMLGGIAAFLREASDDVIYDADELRRQAGLPLLGMLPALPVETESKKFSISLPSQESQSSALPSSQVIYWQPFREACDLLYKNIQLLDSGGSMKSLVVTSVSPGEGKSTLALGLAISAARLHQRVLLVDANLRAPYLHKLLNLPNEQGLSTLLTSHSPIPDQIGSQDADAPSNISILTAGDIPSDPVKLLSSQRMQDAIAAFKQSYDLVVIDAPSVSGKVDPILIGSHCDGLIVVGRVNQVTRTKLRRAIAMLSKLNVIGVVANGLEDFPSAQNNVPSTSPANSSYPKV
jgi:polysaccharide biosynthesis transport protein